MISFAVRSANENSPCTSSGGGAPAPPPRASSLRIFSISWSGGCGGVYRAVAPRRRSSASKIRSISRTAGRSSRQTMYVGPANASAQPSGLAEASERGARSMTSATAPANRPAMSCSVLREFEWTPARSRMSPTTMAQATAANASRADETPRSAAAVVSGSSLSLSSQRAVSAACSSARPASAAPAARSSSIGLDRSLPAPNRQWCDFPGAGQSDLRPLSEAAAMRSIAFWCASHLGPLGNSRAFVRRRQPASTTW